MLRIHFFQKVKEKKNIISSFIIHFFLILFTLQNSVLNKKVDLEKYAIIDVQIYSSLKDEIPEAKLKDNIDTLNKKKLDSLNSSNKIFEKEYISKTNNIKKQPVSKPTEVQSQNDEKEKKFTNKLKKPDKIEGTKEIVKNKSTKKSTNKNSVDNKKSNLSLTSYKEYLKKTIQKEASKNYPRVSLRKKEEGKVEVIFSLHQTGEIKNVDIGSSTKAPKRIIDSLINVLQNKIVRFEKSEILKKTNTFSIIIVYKLE